MKLKRLPLDVIKCIAAGEVIENVASCVRELIENSIDAGATKIEVELREGGKNLIVVRDNGEGMEKEEIPLAVQRYTTSKISKIDDLREKVTLGFRGEALHAIASVSKLRIVSKAKREEGWEGYFEEGKLIELKPSPHPDGTTVHVYELFFNFPVRRKFLGTAKQELRKVVETVTDYALGHPSISISLRSNGEIFLNLPRVDSELERIGEIFGEELASELVEIEKEFEGILLKGFFSPPETMKKTPFFQFIFLNGRRIKEKKLREAIYRAYGSDKMHPQYLLYIDASPSLIDFNVHPQKLEVRFSQGVRIYEKVFTAIQTLLIRKEKKIFLVKEGEKIVGESERKVSFPLKQLELGEIERKEKRAEEGFVPSQIWQIHNSYIIAQVKTGFIIVDQHAAHERVIYERIKKEKSKTKVLLFPLILSLPPSVFKTYKENEPIFLSFGFQVRILSGRTIVIEAIPDVFKQMEKEDFIAILEEVEGIRELPERYQRLLATISCKAAIKNGDPLSQEEASWLIDSLFATENPFFCPHGRPIIIKITLEELDKKFGRK